jgi:hypothetical protein
MTTATARQAAQALGIAPKTLKDQRRKGRIRGVLVEHPNGAYYVYEQAEIERYRAELLGRPGPKRARAPAGCP